MLTNPHAQHRHRTYIYVCMSDSDAEECVAILLKALMATTPGLLTANNKSIASFASSERLADGQISLQTVPVLRVSRSSAAQSGTPFGPTEKE